MSDVARRWCFCSSQSITQLLRTAESPHSLILCIIIIIIIIPFIFLALDLRLSWCGILIIQVPGIWNHVVWYTRSYDSSIAIHKSVLPHIPEDSSLNKAPQFLLQNDGYNRSTLRSQLKTAKISFKHRRKSQIVHSSAAPDFQWFVFTSTHQLSESGFMRKN